MTAALTCRACGALNDDATAATSDDPAAVPAAGAVSICFTCGELAIFTGAGYATRPPDTLERARLNADPHISVLRGSVLLHAALDRGEPS